MGLPLTRKLDLRKAVALAVFVFLVDGHVLSTARMAVTIFFVNSNVVLLVVGTMTVVRKSGRERRVAGFLVFPSARKIGFSFYSDASSLLDGVVCVRRRED